MAALVRNVGAGLVASLLSLAYCLSYGALIFSGPLQPFLSQGVAAALITAATVGCLVAWTSGIRTGIAGPDSNTAAPLATLMAALAGAITAVSPGDGLKLAMAALATTTVLTGALLWFLGWRRLGKLARFLPYPVVAGFLAATGWLLLASAVRMSTGVPLAFRSIAALATMHNAPLLVLTIGWAAVLWMLTARTKSYLMLPAALVAATLLTNLCLLVLGISEPTLGEFGLMFQSSSSGPPLLPLLTGEFFELNWTALARVGGEMVAVAAMAVLTILLNSTSIELETRIETDFDHELKVQGLANLVSALLGGFVGYVSVSRTLVNRAAGATSRLSGTVAGLVALAVLFSGNGVVGHVPRFVMGGLLIQIGCRLLWDWLVLSRAYLPRREWLLILSIVAITAYFGFLQALMFGGLAACIIFALDVSATDVVRGQFGLHERSSSMVRSTEEMRTLAAHGSIVMVLQLGSYLFFGSAYRVQEHLKLLPGAENLRLCIFDFSAVTGIDTSAAASFARIRQSLGETGTRSIVCGLSPPVARLLNVTGSPGTADIFPDLDSALEQGESEVLASHAAAGTIDRPLLVWLEMALGTLEFARELVTRLVPAAVAETGYLCRQGDPAETLLFIERGRVSVLVERPDQEPVRVRVFGAHTLAGEIGFFLESARTASLKIDAQTVVWSLDRNAFHELATSRPDVVLALFTYIVRIQSERLAFATRQIAAF
jgi:sulfate permease, SulP family